MSNSFYYFFSATPQVLAAIMVMFGVLIMYKITSFRDRLIGNAQTITEDLKRNPNQVVSKNQKTPSIIASLERSIVMKEIVLLSYYISEMDNITDAGLMTLVQIYVAKRRALLRLIKWTYLMTFLSSATIIICLCIIPLGEEILCNITLLFITYIVMGILVLLSFGFYVYIFVLCLDIKDLYYSPVKGETLLIKKPSFFKFLFNKI